MLKEMIEYIAKSLVDNPDEVQVSEVEGEQTSVIELKVAKEDLAHSARSRFHQGEKTLRSGDPRVAFSFENG